MNTTSLIDLSNLSKKFFGHFNLQHLAVYSLKKIGGGCMIHPSWMERFFDLQSSSRFIPAPDQVINQPNTGCVEFLKERANSCSSKKKNQQPLFLPKRFAKLSCWAIFLNYVLFYQHTFGLLSVLSQNWAITFYANFSGLLGFRLSEKCCAHNKRFRKWPDTIIQECFCGWSQSEVR